jgi:hypothetical protein
VRATRTPFVGAPGARIGLLSVSRRTARTGTLEDVSTWTTIEAEKAFSQAARARRRASIACRLRGRGDACARLTVHDARVPARRAAATRAGVREIALEAISATLEPNRAEHFDAQFRPAAPTRARWTSIWAAWHRGVDLPPISLVQIGDSYAIRDGHHRVSVARARGAATIDAIVAAA